MSRHLQGVHVTGWGAYAPSHVLTNADLERLVDTSDEWITSRTGIRERHVAGPGETTASLAAVAGLRAITVAGLRPDDVDAIIVGTLTPDFPMPSTASLVKEAIGNTTAFAMDVAAACSGFVYGYATGQALIASGMCRNVLVIGAEVLSRFLDFTDRTTCILFGDGAGAVVLSASDEPGGTVGIQLATEATGAHLIEIPAGGSARPPSPQTLADHEHFIRMKGGETFKLAVRTLGATARAALDQAGLDFDDVELVIPHQANMRIIEATAKTVGLPIEKVFVNLERYGNTSAASVPIALAEAVGSGRVAIGDHLVLVAFGAGLTSGAIALQWTADPARHARAAAIGPDAVHVRPAPVPAIDPFPAALRALLEERRDSTPSNGHHPELSTDAATEAASDVTAPPEALARRP